MCPVYRNVGGRAAHGSSKLTISRPRRRDILVSSFLYVSCNKPMQKQQEGGDSEQLRFPVCVISVDDERLRRTARELEKTDLEFTPVRGVSTARVREDPRVSALARVICTDKILAVALAHVEAASAFLDSSDAPFCLILEDDVAVPPGADISYASIRQGALEGMDEPWDIVRLHSAAGGFPLDPRSPGDTVGRRPVRSHGLTASLAAYLLSRRGALKLRHHRIVYHLDILVNSPYFRTFTGPQLFKTFDLRGGPCLRGQSLAYYAAQDLARVGPVRVGLGFFCVFSLLVLVAVLSASFADAPAVVLLQQVGLAYLALGISFATLLTSEFGLYRCAEATGAFSLAFPIILVLFCLFSGAPASPARTLVLLGAYVMLWHRILHESLRRDGAWPDMDVARTPHAFGRSESSSGAA